MAGTRYKNVAIEASYTLGLAKAFSGAPSEGQANCENARESASTAGDQGLLSRAMLALAETTLENGDPQSALKIATECRDRFARAGQKESEWKALVVAGRANRAISETIAAEEQLSQAGKILMQLQQTLGADATSYLARPDIDVLRKSLRDL